MLAKKRQGRRQSWIALRQIRAIGWALIGVIAAEGLLWCDLFGLVSDTDKWTAPARVLFVLSAGFVVYVVKSQGMIRELGERHTARRRVDLLSKAYSKGDTLSFAQLASEADYRHWIKQYARWIGRAVPLVERLYGAAEAGMLMPSDWELDERRRASVPLDLKGWEAEHALKKTLLNLILERMERLIEAKTRDPQTF
jgi:hypothetical protein